IDKLPKGDKRIAGLRKERKDLEARPLPVPQAFAMAEGKRWVGDARKQTAGDPTKLGPVVPRRFLSVFGGEKLPSDVKGSGRLQPFPAVSTWNYTQHNPFKAVYHHDRRSVYLMTQRIARHPYLALFDGPDTNASTARRVSSTTPLQALFLLNDPFVHRLAEAL